MRKIYFQIAHVLLKTWLQVLAHNVKCAVDHVNRSENSSFEKATDLISNLHEY